MQLSLCAARGSSSNCTEGFVQIVSGEYVFQCGAPSSTALAWGTLNDTRKANGWAFLQISSRVAATISEQKSVFHATGYLEAALTQRHIWELFEDAISGFIFGGLDIPAVSTLPAETRQELLREGELAWVYEYCEKQVKWIQEMTTQHENDTYWHNVALVFEQLAGLQEGYQKVAPWYESLLEVELYLITSVADMMDVFSAAKLHTTGEGEDWSGPAETVLWNAMKRVHCSALIKVVEDRSEVYTAHATWTMYGFMNRMYKTFNLSTSLGSSQVVSFSSYPGFLSSVDDFYMLSSGLVVLETTNNVFNTSLYYAVQPESLLSWMRVLVANRLASSAKEWTDLFQQYNSGTYNNQWMVVDYNLVEKVQTVRAHSAATVASLPNNTLRIIEQVPGLALAKDVTCYLRERGFWSSYNIPFQEEIYSVSGYPSMVEKYGFPFNYSGCPRAEIFKRDAPAVETLEDMKHIMRYNDYLNDPLSRGNPAYAICSRVDLAEGSNKHAFGCIDGKVTFSAWLREGRAAIVSSPTHETLAPFSWNEFPTELHPGQPELFNFSWVYL